MSDTNQTRRVTMRLTPYQARQLWRLRTQGIPDGQPPRTATEIILAGLNKLHNETFPLEKEGPAIKEGYYETGKELADRVEKEADIVGSSQR